MDDIEQQLRTEYEKLTKRLADPAVFSTAEGQQLAKQHGALSETISLFDERQRLQTQIADTQKMLEDKDLAKLAETELPRLTDKLTAIERQLEEALVPTDPNDSKNAIVEIRAGTGGNEASLFAGDLYRMYGRFVEKQGWRVELAGENPSEVGGFKEIIFIVRGGGAYGALKHESGVHRVQRVPATESSGRIHTSTATVAVLPEAEETDIQIDPPDLRIDVFRSSGPGGQSVNTTDSAVRITHLPTGITVTCQDEKSQHKNKAKAMNILRSRLLAARLAEEQAKRANQRKSQIGTGERSEKIRTYNFPQDRVTDHRINLTIKNLPGVLNGDIGRLVAKLRARERELAKVNTELS